MSDFDVDKLTLSCLVNRKHHKHLGDTFSTDMFSPKTSYIEEAIQEHLPYLVQKFEYYCTHQSESIKVQHHMEKLIELLLREREDDSNKDHIMEDEYGSKEKDEETLFGGDCTDLRETGEARQPTAIEYWKMQQVFKN